VLDRYNNIFNFVSRTIYGTYTQKPGKHTAIYYAPENQLSIASLTIASHSFSHSFTVLYPSSTPTMSTSLEIQTPHDLTHWSQHHSNREDALNVWSTMSDNLPDTPPPEELDVQDRPNSNIPQPVTASEKPLVAVIGVGYVGHHLVTAFAPHYNLIAFDVSQKRLLAVAPGLSQYASSITWATDASAIAPATHFLIAVPTSLLPNKGINTSYLREAIGAIALYARPGATVVVESSVAVGMTRQLLAPLMRSRGVMAGMSPEVIPLYFPSSSHPN